MEIERIERIERMERIGKDGEKRESRIGCGADVGVVTISGHTFIALSCTITKYLTTWKINISHRSSL